MASTSVRMNTRSMLWQSMYTHTPMMPLCVAVHCLSHSKIILSLRSYMHWLFDCTPHLLYSGFIYSVRMYTLYGCMVVYLIWSIPKLTDTCKSIGTGIIHILHKVNYIATFLLCRLPPWRMYSAFGSIILLCVVNCRNVYLHTDRITDTAHALDFYVGLTQARQSLIHNYYRDACCPGIGWNLACRPAFHLGSGHSSNQPSACRRWP